MQRPASIFKAFREAKKPRIADRESSRNGATEPFRRRLKIRFPQGSESSILSFGTNTYDSFPRGARSAISYAVRNSGVIMGEVKRKAAAEELQLVDVDHVYLRMVRKAFARGNIPAGVFECFVMHEDGCPKMATDEGLCACAPTVIVQMEADNRRFTVADDGSLTPVSTN